MRQALPLFESFIAPAPEEALTVDEGAEDGCPAAVDDPPRRRAAVSELDETALVALIERIIDRDERALAALYDAASPRVYGLVLRITRRAALAEEVVEDTFWQAWRQAPRFEAARGKVMTWLLAMARSRAIDALRRDERFRHADLPEEGSLEDEADTALPAHDLLEATRGEARVHQAIAALEPRARQLVALAFFRGLTHEEIAAQAAMPLGTVKSLIRRALLQLRTLLEDDLCRPC
ncbi:sigma-70 family RNA polymerase sigma factor [Aquabacterium sp.]|uniref:sigma-70 family RNA polymerase sigma factor n=1 Tax=Aquabacterium sp. TaxID=1872578 RepID=UPI0037837B8E